MPEHPPGLYRIDPNERYDTQWDRMVAKSEHLLTILDDSISKSRDPDKLLFMRDRVAMRMEHFKRKAKEEKGKRQKI